MRDLSSTDTRVMQGTYLELVQSVLATLLPTTIMGILFVIVSALSLVRHPDALTGVLAVTGILASLLRIAIIATYRRAISRAALTVDGAARFERLFGRTYVAFAIVLGSFAARCVLSSDSDLHMVVAALVVGYAAGVAAGVSLRPRISIVAINCSVLPLAFACIADGGAAHLTLALVLVALLIGGMTSMLGRYRWTADTIAMRHLLGSLARHDPLTGLSNRLELAEAYGRFQSSDNHPILALHCLDLDRFKAVNDRFGHSTGDRLLQMVALRLSSLASKADMAVRLGGDEFALLQTGINHPGEVDLVRRRITKALSEPYSIDERTICVGVSVGSALTSDRDVPLQSLMEEADAASYLEKSAGRRGSFLNLLGDAEFASNHLGN
jgi:diguanylate cyclase